MSRLAGLGAVWRLTRDACHDAARRARRRAVALVLAVGLALIGSGFLSGAVYLYLARQVEPWQAAGVTALIIAAVAALLAVVPPLGRRRGRRSREARASRNDDVAGLTSSVVEEVLHGGSLRPSDLAIAGLVAGIALGVLSRRRPPRRRRDDREG